MTKEYNADSIQKLSFREGVRQRVGMYLGAPDMTGVYNGLFEIISNSVDEAIVGFGKQIEIEVGPQTASVKDHGRGIPRGPKGDIEEILIILLTESHSGAKFSDESYTKVRGLNGIGSGATNCSSDYFKVETSRDGFKWTLEFDKGIPRTPTATKGIATKETGTYIYFEPSVEVFSAEPILFDFEEVSKRVEDMSYLLPGLTFIVKNTLTKEERSFCSKNGIIDLLTKTVDSPLTKPAITGKVEDPINTIEIAMKWSKRGHSERFYLFVNGAECSEGGTPITGMRSAITRAINKESKKSFTGELVRRGLTYIISCSVSRPLFANQTKTKISNPELRGLAEKAFAEAWKDFTLKYPRDVEMIVEMLAKEERAEKAADKARESILGHTKDIEDANKKKVLLATKLKDCEKHGEEATLVICEGDSALGALTKARPVENVALLPIRGKIINCLRHDIDKILENEEIKSILMCLNCGMGDKYNASKLKYGKIAIAVDGDADGYNIMCLITTFIYALIPKFLEEGRLHWLRAPLYKVEYKTENCYAFDDEELAAIQKKKGKGTIKRFKGLGEMNTKDTAQSMFGKDQRIEKFVTKDRVATYTQIENLMGKEVEGRRNYIFENIDFSVLEE